MSVSLLSNLFNFSCITQKASFLDAKFWWDRIWFCPVAIISSWSIPLDIVENVEYLIPAKPGGDLTRKASVGPLENFALGDFGEIGD